MTQRNVNYAAGEKLEELVSLKDITVSHNPRASLRGVLDLFHSEGSASNSPESRQGFVAYMQEEHPEIDMLRLSIQDHGLLQAPTLRSFRAKENEDYVQRYGIVMGEGRILSYALLEAMTGVPQKVRVRVESKLSVDSAFEKGLVENLDRNEMNPVDLAVAFHEMLTIRINPVTKLAELNGQSNPLYTPKGRPYTMKELAERVRKTYQWVRLYEALFYLPEKQQLQCIKAWQEGKRNVTKFCKLGLEYKAKITGQSEEIGLDNQTVTTNNLNDGNLSEVVGTENATVVSTENEVETETQFAPAKRRHVLSYKAVVELFDKTALENKERLSALAEVMGLKLEDALVERDIRLANQADIEARKQQKAA